MTNINWQVRVKNKWFWIALIPALILAVQAVANVFGISLELSGLSDRLEYAIESIFLVLGILGIVTDPTTDGVGDSKRAMTYAEPRKDTIESDDMVG